MLLVIDIGNTNTVIGVYKEETLIRHWRIQTNRKSTADELALIYRQLFAFEEEPSLKHTDIDAAIICSVVPPVEHAVVQMVSNFFKVMPLMVGSNIDVDIPILLAEPKQVGADRLVNSVAAWNRFKRANIVVDFGTATTFDAIADDGSYLGGAIAPGVGISSEALFHAASKLPRVDFGHPNHVIGQTTVEAIQSGLWYGYVGLVKELVSRIKSELSPNAAVVATGGLAYFIERETDIIDLVDPFLTLEGLRLIWKQANL